MLPETTGEAEESPACLDSLPLEIIQQIMCAAGGAGSAESADALTCVNRKLSTLTSSSQSGVLPIFSSPDSTMNLCCSDGVVRWDASTGTLRKTSRLGNPVIVFAQPLCRRSLLLELQLEHLPTVGGIQVGVLRDAPYSANGEVLHWFDGAGRVNSRDGSNDFIVSLFGERLRSGDKLGVCYLAAERAVGFTLNDGGLMGPPLPLPPPDSQLSLRFYCRFDCVEGTEARVIRSRTALLDSASLIASAAAYVPRPPCAPADRTVLVRTLGPDSRCFVIAIDPERATVSELHEQVLIALKVDAWHVVELRVTEARTSSGTRLIYGERERDPHDRSGVRLTLDPKRTLLCDAGIGFDSASGNQLRDVLVSLPHMIS